MGRISRVYGPRTIRGEVFGGARLTSERTLKKNVSSRQAQCIRHVHDPKGAFLADVKPKYRLLRRGRTDSGKCKQRLSKVGCSVLAALGVYGFWLLMGKEVRFAEDNFRARGWKERSWQGLL